MRADRQLYCRELTVLRRSRPRHFTSQHVEIMLTIYHEGSSLWGCHIRERCTVPFDPIVCRTALRERRRPDRGQIERRCLPAQARCLD